jgi:transcriptional regulator with XRE-family HTH domain
MARQRLPSLNARIRTRRTQLGLTGAELSQRADISPSYVSLIERGTKVPDEDVAARIAKALRDDQDLYRAWARASRLGLERITLLNRIETISRSPTYTSLFERGEAVPDEPPPEDALAERSAPDRRLGGSLVESRAETFAAFGREPLEASRARRSPQPRPLTIPAPLPAPSGPASLAAPAHTEILRIPVLADGADPGRTVPAPLSVRDRLLVDRRLVADHAPDRLFAYEVTVPSMKHLRGLASPGDRIVFQRGGRAGPDRICAVRTKDGVVLSRVLFKGRSLLLLPGEGGQDFASVDVEGVKALPGVVAGTHVLLIRR